jgi:hypothetical protein
VVKHPGAHLGAILDIRGFDLLRQFFCKRHQQGCICCSGYIFACSGNCIGVDESYTSGGCGQVQENRKLQQKHSVAARESSESPSAMQTDAGTIVTIPFDDAAHK